MQNTANYVKVKYLYGGWYSFSVSGHAYYSNHDEIKVQGKKKLAKSLKENGVWSILNDEKIGI